MKKVQAARSTPFSEFFRSASTDKKKSVYAVVLQRATERQLNVLKAG
ncbi:MULTISPECIES: hypothetical protein [unclassified Pseudomonas]|nr:MULTISPECIES: hypothetical protein [unclassified Pseudomonas]VVN78399.1 hypothetical protein PS720_00890 [Pseudomonas fluorescens]